VLLTLRSNLLGSLTDYALGLGGASAECSPPKSLPKLPERPRPPDTKKTEEGITSADQPEQAHIQVENAKCKSWLPSLGKSEYIVLSLCWACYSIFNVLAYRNSGT
jgi:hypothetical protein